MKQLTLIEDFPNLWQEEFVVVGVYHWKMLKQSKKIDKYWRWENFNNYELYFPLIIFEKLIIFFYFLY